MTPHDSPLLDGVIREWRTFEKHNSNITFNGSVQHLPVSNQKPSFRKPYWQGSLEMKLILEFKYYND